jgi:hypothetical protein
MVTTIIIGIIIGIGISNVEAAVEYLGEFCWEAKGGVAILKLGILHIGDGHLLVSGKLLDKGHLKEVVHGNAEIEGSNVIVTLNSSDKDDKEIVTGTRHIIIDLSTLNATAEGIFHGYGYSNQLFETEHEELDVLTFISCP